MSAPAPIARVPVRRFVGTKLSNLHWALLLLGLLAAIDLSFPVWRAFLPLELNPSEPWTAWHTDSVLRGTPLYPRPDELIANNYPPLFFYLAAAVSKLTSDSILAGRLLSLLSLGVIAIAIGGCVRNLGGSWGAAAFGALWLLATMGRFFTKSVGLNDPNSVALAIMGSALAVFLARLRAGKSVEAAIALMVLAGFFKHNLFAIPLTALLWLFLTRNRHAVRTALFGISLAGAGLALCTAVYGGDFIQQMLMPRVTSLEHMFSLINKFQWVAPALLFWGIWAWQNRHETAARFSALLVAVAIATCLLQMSGAGTAISVLFEVVFASAIAVALAFDHIAATGFAQRFGVERVQNVMIAVLVLRLLLSQQLEAYLTLSSPAFRAEIYGKAALMRAEIERVRALPGPVFCSVKTVCYRAGKAFVYDNFVMSQRVATNKWTSGELDEAIAKAGIRFVTIDPGVDWDRKRLF